MDKGLERRDREKERGIDRGQKVWLSEIGAQREGLRERDKRERDREGDTESDREGDR